ncbi:hypothetical protein Cgig2_033558 [Carnegiea gigantea]|uniref:Uncharacterized protein n=1 Tax=Carnegiea gigantea TaxID=171969 RepID=A0A9Q1JGZ6_9CARY|nr:hypothetical protein Cgig2_033558 [Carnegiea gigantea]
MPLKTDEPRKDKFMLCFARVLVDVQLDSPFQDFVHFWLSREKWHLKGTMGLNNPNKQKDNKNILKQHKVGLVGLLETKRIAFSINGVWCILGDFNIVLDPLERIGRNEALAGEIEDFNSYITACEQVQMRYFRSQFTWTSELTKTNSTQYRNQCSKLCFTRVKKRKENTYIYSLLDNERSQVNGFQDMASVMLELYKKLLGQQ